MSLPEGYVEGVDRVSNIVGFKYPFGGEAKVRYLKWVYEKLKTYIPNKREATSQECLSLVQEFPSLSGVDISHLIDCEKEYLTEACDVGTFIHLQMEKYMLDKFNQDVNSPDYKTHFNAISHGLDYIDGLKEKYPDIIWSPEQVVRDKDNRYQGTIDLIRVNEETKTVWLYDWKTWGIAKKRWGMPNVPRKPYDKLKKLALQLSLYAETYRQKGYKIGGIYGVWLHETATLEYDLPLASSEDIDILLDKFLKRKEIIPPNIDLIINYNPMKVEVNTAIPDMAYSNARVVLEAEDVKEEGSPKKAIVKAIALQKYLLGQYSK